MRLATVPLMPWQRVATEPLDIDTGVTPASARAIGDAVVRRAVPLLVRRDGRIEPLATAALYRVGGRVVLVTCRHIFDQPIALGDLGIPLPAQHRIIGLQQCARRVMVHPERDLALIELVAGAAREELLRHWVPVLIADDDLHQPPSDGGADLFVLAGWPYAQMRRIADVVYARPVVFFAGRALLPADDGLRLSYARVARRTDGIDVHAPELDGVSGATVWRVSGLGQTSEGACVLLPAAVQFAFKHDAYARAESLAQARGLMERVRQ